MNKIILYTSIGVVALIIILSVNRSGKSDDANKVLDSTSNPKSTATQSVIPADKIEVVHFHATQQCWSCITVGKYALETIQEKFPEEYKSGKIVFTDVNGELKENQEMVEKYQARGSSLFINAIRGDKDEIVEDVTVWRLVSNDAQFTDYFSKKLHQLFGN